MKRVLVLKFPFSSRYGGGERHTLVLVEQLKKLGFEFFLVANCPILLAEFKKRSWSEQRLWLPAEPVSKIALVLFPLWAWYGFFVLTAALIHHRWKHGVRQLYCLSLTEKILATLPARLLGYKVFWIEHVGFRRWLTQNPLRFFYRLFSNLATTVVISEALKKQLINLGIKPKHIAVIYNGYDFKTYQAIRTEPSKRHSGQFIVGTVSRLEKEKGLEYLLLACQKAVEIIPDLRLVIVGEGTNRKRLEWLAKNLGLDRLTQFVGFQDSPSHWVKDFDVFVLPSVSRESFGSALVEALALEKPVVASELEGTPEIVKQNQTGLLVAPGNSEELAQAIIYLHQNPEIGYELALAGRLFVERKFPLERMIQNFYSLFTA